MNISIDLLEESINFKNGSYEHKNNIIQSYYYNIKDITFDHFDELLTKIIKIKGDWVRSDYRLADDCLEVKFCLIFHDEDLSETERLIIKNVDSSIKEYFSDHQLFKSKSCPSIDKPKEIEDQEGFLISINGDGGVGYLSKKDVEETFIKSNIPCQIISEHKTHFYGGASGGSESIVFFVLSSIGSGLTWDSIKILLSMHLRQPLEYFRVGFIDSLKYKNLRKTIASRVNEDYYSLDLYEFYTTKNKVMLEFRTKNKRIEVVCDMNYIIKELKVMENVV